MKKKIVSVVLPVEVAEQIKELAKLEGLSVSAMAGRLIQRQTQFQSALNDVNRHGISEHTP